MRDDRQRLVARLDRSAGLFAHGLGRAERLFALDPKHSGRDRAMHRRLERLELDRLGEVALRAGAHAFERDSHAAVGGEEDDRKVGLGCMQRAAELQAVAARHRDVGDDDVGGLGSMRLES